MTMRQPVHGKVVGAALLAAWGLSDLRVRSIKIEMDVMSAVDVTLVVTADDSLVEVLRKFELVECVEEDVA